jgi:hypothetical protein
VFTSQKLRENVKKHLQITTSHVQEAKLKRILEQCDSPKDDFDMQTIERLVEIERHLKRFYDEPTTDKETDWKKLFLHNMMREKVFGNLATEMKLFYSGRGRSSPKYFELAPTSNAKCAFCGQYIPKDSLRSWIRVKGKQAACYVHASCDLWVRGTSGR